MVIRGNSRGNGRQLANYLLDKKDNSRVWILDIDGKEEPQAKDLRHALFDMSVTAELTNGTKGLYHAQINPDEAASQQMTDQDWHLAADILGKHLGYEGQRRAIVMHEKKGRVHAHVVWERYDFEKGILKPDSFNFAAQDKARHEMERLFKQKETPKRNKNQPELKAALTDIWNRSATGQDFIRASNEKGYILAAGTQRHPFMIVDKEARSFDLVRQLKGVRIKEVRQKMRGIDLMNEKQAIEQAKKKTEKETETVEIKTEPVKPQKTAHEKKKTDFILNKNDINWATTTTFDPGNYIKNKQDIFSSPQSNKQDMHDRKEAPKDEPQKSFKEKLEAYRKNKDGIAGEKEKTDRERMKEDNREDLTAQRDRTLQRLKEARESIEKSKDRGLERE